LRRRSEAVLFEKGKVIGNLSGTGGEEIGKVHGAERAGCGGMEEADLRQAIEARTNPQLSIGGRTVECRLELSTRQQEILLAGGLLNLGKS